MRFRQPAIQLSTEGAFPVITESVRQQWPKKTIMPREIDDGENLGHQGVVEPFIADPKTDPVTLAIPLAIEQGILNRDTALGGVNDTLGIVITLYLALKELYIDIQIVEKSSVDTDDPE